MSHADTPAMKKQNVKKEIDVDCKGLCTPKCEHTTHTLPVAKRQLPLKQVMIKQEHGAKSKADARAQLKAKCPPTKKPTNPNAIIKRPPTKKQTNPNAIADNADDASGSQCMQPEAFIVISQSWSHGVRCC